MKYRIVDNKDYLKYITKTLAVRHKETARLWTRSYIRNSLLIFVKLTLHVIRDKLNCSQIGTQLVK